jgi:hypothetical protein
MAGAVAAGPVPKAGGGRGGGGGPAPFLTKTHQMVEERATDEVVSWAEQGRSFVVWKPVEFARDLLPLHFKHCNFSSFVRQLNTYVRTHSSSLTSYVNFPPLFVQFLLCCYYCCIIIVIYFFPLFVPSIDRDQARFIATVCVYFPLTADKFSSRQVRATSDLLP